MNAEHRVKRVVSDLAVFGGVPEFEEPRHVGRPNIGDEARLLERLQDMLQRRWLTNGGPYVEQFETRIAELAGARNCVATCNATIALEILMRALGLSGEVIVPSFSFVASAHAVHWLGLTPVFCDIDPQTHNLDPASVEALITPRTAAILGVHVWGRACPVDALREIADRYSLALIYDAAHALGATSRGRSIGSFGDAEVFSFHATKFVNAFEGGAITTNDDALADRLRLMRNFGFADYDLVTSLGTNGKMSEIAAAMGLTSLESMQEFLTANRQNYSTYAELLSGLPGIDLVAYAQREQSNYQYVVLEVDSSAARIQRDTLLEIMRAENVLARRYFYPGCHRVEPYVSLDPDAGHRLPFTEQLTERVLQLPTGTAVSRHDVARICAILRFAIANAPEVEERLSGRTSSDPVPTAC